MAFQGKIYINQGLGKPGTISRLNPYTTLPMVAEGDAVVAGKFVFPGTDAEHQVKGASAETSSAESVAGLCIFEKYQLALNAGDSLAVNAGEEVAVMLKGYAYVLSTTAATKGQKVIVNLTTGEIKTGDSASEGELDTGWVVETGGAANGVCEICKL